MRYDASCIGPAVSIAHPTAGSDPAKHTPCTTVLASVASFPPPRGPRWGTAAFSLPLPVTNRRSTSHVWSGSTAPRRTLFSFEPAALSLLRRGPSWGTPPLSFPLPRTNERRASESSQASRLHTSHAWCGSIAPRRTFPTFDPATPFLLRHGTSWGMTPLSIPFPLPHTNETQACESSQVSPRRESRTP